MILQHASNDSASMHDIQAMDGHRLSQLAYEAGLAPSTTACHADGTYWTEVGAQRQWVLWCPQTDVGQSDAVFRQLRARGWSTSVLWLADDRHYGDVWASTEGRAVSVQWPRDAPTEALALLRCAVLAMAYDGRHDVPSACEPCVDAL